MIRLSATRRRLACPVRNDDNVSRQEHEDIRKAAMHRRLWEPRMRQHLRNKGVMRWMFAGVIGRIASELLPSCGGGFGDAYTPSFPRGPKANASARMQVCKKVRPSLLASRTIRVAGRS